MWRYRRAVQALGAVTLLFSLATCLVTVPPVDPTEVNFTAKLADYVNVSLEPDLSQLDESQRRMLPLLRDASRVMDGLFWRQAFGDRSSFLSGIENSGARRFAEINYGPWDRLDNNRPFLTGIGPKPPGASFYPMDMAKAEFEEAAAADPELRSLYTLVRRDSQGSLRAIPYHVAFRDELAAVAGLLRSAADLAKDDAFRRYLRMRADAFESSDYQPSDFAWMEMLDNDIDLVIGPIETYEDRLFGSKAAFEAYVLIKDKDWSARLEKYSAMLPALQRGLPVPDRYKAEAPGSNSQLNAYDVLYYAGDCNAGAKTIAINLPNDEEVQLSLGSRRLQLKNAMRAKFDHILQPIAGRLIDPEQRELISFDAFFANTMFHEVAHGLGIKNTLDGTGTVREALRDRSSALEEAKADILGLHLIGRLAASGEAPSGAAEANYVTFLAGIFRSVRFGASSAHGRANTLAFNFFQQRDAFERDSASGKYRVNPNRMSEAVDALASRILRLQGDGDYAGAVEFLEAHATLDQAALADLDSLEAADIPVDIVVDQPWLGD